MPHAIRQVADLEPLAGKRLPPSAWLDVTQARIDQFAAATEDRQWIHCDPERAQRESPYGATIAHGFLTLSLIPALLDEVLAFPTARMVINYGLNRVRFPQAVPAGSRVRLQVEPQQVTPRDDAIDLQCACLVELEGQAKPACVAELLLRICF